VQKLALETLVDMAQSSPQKQAELQQKVGTRYTHAWHIDHPLYHTSAHTSAPLNHAVRHGINSAYSIFVQGGLDLFTGMAQRCLESDIRSPLLGPCLWALRNTAHSDRAAMTRMGRRGVLELLLGVIRECKGVLALASTLEAALAALLALTIGHEVRHPRVSTFVAPLSLFSPARFRRTPFLRLRGGCLPSLARLAGGPYPYTPRPLHP
jgi:hypothetical protein